MSWDTVLCIVLSNNNQNKLILPEILVASVLFGTQVLVFVLGLIISFMISKSNYMKVIDVMIAPIKRIPKWKWFLIGSFVTIYIEITIYLYPNRKMHPDLMANPVIDLKDSVNYFIQTRCETDAFLRGLDFTPLPDDYLDDIENKAKDLDKQKINDGFNDENDNNKRKHKNINKLNINLYENFTTIDEVVGDQI